MSFDKFGCERRFIDGIYRETQRNILIAEYCTGNFGLINFVDMYYRIFQGNAIIILLIAGILFPLFLVLISYTTNKYIVSSMKAIARNFSMTPPISAVFIVAIINGTSEIFNSYNDAALSNGNSITLGSLIGGFIFSGCMGITNVVYSSKGVIALPKYATLKELFTLLAAFCIVLVFGLIKKTNALFFTIMAVLYVVYILGTFKAQKLDSERQEELQYNEDAYRDEEEAENPFNDDLEKSVEEVKPSEPKRVSVVQDIKRSSKIGNVNKSDISFDQKSNADGRQSTLALTKSVFGAESTYFEDAGEKNIFVQIYEELQAKEGYFLEDLIGPPMKLISLGFITNSSNPLMRTPLKFVVVSVGFAITQYSLQIVSMSVSSYILIGIVGGIGVFILTLMGFDRTNAFIMEITSIFPALAITKIFSTLVVDVVYFMMFYFSVNEILLGALLIGMSNSLTDLFDNGALARSNDEVMGFLATYSSQVFNFLITFGIYNLILAIRGESNFDIFGLDLEASPEENSSTGSYLMMALIFVAIMLIIVKLSYFHVNDYIVKSDFPKIMLSVYLFFFFGCIGIGFLIS